MKFRHIVLAIFIICIGSVLTIIGRAQDLTDPVLGPLGLGWETLRRAHSVYGYGQSRLLVDYSEADRDLARDEFERQRAALEAPRSLTGSLLIDGAKAVHLWRNVEVAWDEQSPYNPALVFVCLGPGPAAIYYLPDRQEYAVLGRVRVEPFLEEVNNAILNKFGQAERPLPVPPVAEDLTNK